MKNMFKKLVCVGLVGLFVLGNTCNTVEAEKHFFNALQIFYSNKIGNISNENLEIINWLTPTYVPKMTSYDTSKIDYETLILKRQEKNGLYDL